MRTFFIALIAIALSIIAGILYYRLPELLPEKGPKDQTLETDQRKKLPKPAEKGGPEYRLARVLIEMGGAIGIHKRTDMISTVADLPPNPFIQKLRYPSDHVLSKEDMDAWKTLKSMQQVWFPHKATPNALKMADGIDLLYISSAHCMTNDSLTFLASTKHLISLELSQSKISDDGVDNLPILEQAKWIGMNRTSVGDKMMAKLRQFPQLDILEIAETQVSDKGVKELCKSESLWALNLNDNINITDESIEYLGREMQMEYLLLVNTGMSAEGISRLRKMLTSCTIVTNQKGVPTAREAIRLRAESKP